MKCVLSQIENDAPVGDGFPVPKQTNTTNRKSESNEKNDSVGDGFPVPQVRLKPYGVIVKKWIEHISLKYPTVFVDAYVIMPNHIHLLFRIDSYGSGNPTPTISAVIAWLKYMISKEINKDNDVKKSIWQRSFHDHIIRNEEDFLLHWQYIDENPKKWLMGKDKYYC